MPHKIYIVQEHKPGPIELVWADKEPKKQNYHLKAHLHDAIGNCKLAVLNGVQNSYLITQERTKALAKFFDESRDLTRVNSKPNWLFTLSSANHVYEVCEHFNVISVSLVPIGYNTNGGYQFHVVVRKSGMMRSNDHNHNMKAITKNQAMILIDAQKKMFEDKAKNDLQGFFDAQQKYNFFTLEKAKKANPTNLASIGDVVKKLRSYKQQGNATKLLKRILAGETVNIGLKKKTKTNLSDREFDGLKQFAIETGTIIYKLAINPCFKLSDEFSKQNMNFITFS